jgi:hypothetical protein
MVSQQFASPCGADGAIDQDDYSSKLLPVDNPEEVSVPPKTGVRQKFLLGRAEGGRLCGRDYTTK